MRGDMADKPSFVVEVVPSASGDPGQFKVEVEGERHAFIEGIFGTAEEVAFWVENVLESGSPDAATCIRGDGRDAAWIEYIYVDPSSRRQGVGHEMVRLAMEALKKVDIGQVWLLAEPESGTKSDREKLIRFYGGHGFGLAPEECRGGEDIMAAFLDTAK